MVTKKKKNLFSFPTEKNHFHYALWDFLPHWTRMYVKLLGPCFKTGRARAPLDPALFFFSLCPACQKGSNITLSAQRTPITIESSPIVMWSLWTEKELKPHWFPTSYNRKKIFVSNSTSQPLNSKLIKQKKLSFQRKKEPPTRSLIGGKKKFTSLVLVLRLENEKYANQSPFCEKTRAGPWIETFPQFLHKKKTSSAESIS